MEGLGVRSDLWEQFQKLQQELMMSQTEEDAKRINQQITLLLNVLEDDEEKEDDI